VHAACLVHLSVLDLIILIIFSEEYKLFCIIVCKNVKMETSELYLEPEQTINPYSLLLLLLPLLLLLSSSSSSSHIIQCNMISAVDRASLAYI
jgi:hypothetical protein